MDRKDTIAEVALELTEDRGDRVSVKARAAGRIEAVERLQHPQAGDLEEVIDPLTSAAVAKGEAAREGKVVLGELLTGGPAACAVVPVVEIPLVQLHSAKPPLESGGTWSADRKSRGEPSLGGLAALCKSRARLARSDPASILVGRRGCCRCPAPKGPGGPGYDSPAAPSEPSGGCRTNASTAQSGSTAWSLRNAITGRPTMRSISRLACSRNSV